MVTENLLDHVKDDTIWKAAGAFVSALAIGLLGTLKMLYNKERKAIDCLYEWKDEVVDPHIRAIPIEYVRAPYCNQKHEEALTTYEKRHDQLIAEVLHIRGILEKHLINGSPDK